MHVYIHLPDDRVFSGLLQNLKGIKIPFWVTNPHRLYNSKYHVYVRLPDGRGLISIIQPLHHAININDDLHEDNRCFVSTGNSTLLSAFLYHYTHPVLISGRTRVFVRMPHDNSTYVGMLNYDDSRRPSWIQ